MFLLGLCVGEDPKMRLGSCKMSLARRRNTPTYSVEGTCGPEYWYIRTVADEGLRTT